MSHCANRVGTRCQHRLVEPKNTAERCHDANNLPSTDQYRTADTTGLCLLSRVDQPKHANFPRCDP